MPVPQIVLDWDGTVTEQDTLSLALQHFVAPGTLEPLTVRVDAALAAGSMTLRDVMTAEFAALTAPLDAVVAFIVAHARVRPGFAEFVTRYDPLILSTSFQQTIEPILAREGLTARVRASHAEPDPRGWHIRWVTTADCAICGEPCKRAALPAPPFIYIGDGYSDRCAALAAERIFARDGLARYLEGRGVAYEPFTDFHSIDASLRSA
jgi:2-hydroxy-3-keto-5-methylthiopentenyl-1-phosphate phosphatase